MLQVGIRYLANLLAMVAQQRGYLIAAVEGGRFVITELVKIPRMIYFSLPLSVYPEQASRHPLMYSDEIVAALADLKVEMKTYSINQHAFQAHVATIGYPRNYAAGPMAEGGVREEKLLEYFVSLDLLAVRPTDVVVDVASQWSIFPQVVRKLSQATVYRQDLIYTPGIRGDRIGSNAAHMPVPDGFADKLVLHNAFGHFEGTADTDFIIEAWRVLKQGGILCILPLFMAHTHINLTDPLVDRRGVVWDERAQVVELPWWHNRFGRLYDAAALQERIITPARKLGFKPTIYHFINVQEIHPAASLHFALVMHKSDTVKK